MMIDLGKTKAVFKRYVNNYNLQDEKIALKYNHILRVSSISKKIATQLNLSEEDIKLAELIGIFHDIGRFEQVRKYNTFIDKNSINHGEYGAKVLFEEGLIKQFEVDERYYRIIKLAVINHNRSTIEEGLTEHEQMHCKIIRDSDKLDIFHVLLTDKTINTYGIESMENENFTEEIMREFKEDHYINYKNRKTYGDIWISHIAYAFDLNFKSSYEVLKENNYINKLLAYMNFKNEETLKNAKEMVEIANEFIEKKIC